MKVKTLIILVFLTGCNHSNNTDKTLAILSDSQILTSEYKSLFENSDSIITEGNDGFQLIGLTSGLTDSTQIYLVDPYSNTNLDSAITIDNKFFLKGKVNSYSRFYLKNNDQWKTIWVENSKMVFDARGTTFKKAKVLGSRIQDQDNEWFNAVEVLDMKDDSIGDLMKTVPRYKILKTLSLGIPRYRFHVIKKRADINFITSHPDYIISAYSLSFLMHNIKPKRTEKLYNILSDSVKKTSYGRQIKLFLENPNHLIFGDKAINFTLLSNEGREISLSSFNGHYVLLEFWASWCGPCINEIPYLGSAYKKYNGDGFEILSVSIDANESDWKSAIEKYNMNWTHVLDSKEGDVALKYKINGIPRNYLIDPEGTMIKMNLRGDNLQSTLEKIFLK